MFKRHWFAILVLAGLALCGATIGSGAHYLTHTNDEGTNADRTQKQKHIAAQELTKPKILNRSCAPKTPNEKESAKQPDWWIEDDLDAQRQMARWTKYIGYLTGVMAAITLGGVIMIWRTLFYTERGLRYMRRTLVEAGRTTRAAKETTKEATRIGEAQVRGHIVVPRIQATVTKKANEFEAKGTVKFSCQGATPVTDVVVFVYSEFFTDGAGKPERTPLETRQEIQFRHFLPNLTANSFDTVNFSRSCTGALAESVSRGVHLLHVYGSIHYTDVFGTRWTQLYTFELPHNDMLKATIHVDSEAYTPLEVCLSRCRFGNNESGKRKTIEPSA